MVASIAHLAQSTSPDVIVLHNIDPQWALSDTVIAMDSVNQVVNALVAEGHRVKEVPVTGTDLAAILAPCEPAKHIVLGV